VPARSSLADPFVLLLGAFALSAVAWAAGGDSGSGALFGLAFVGLLAVSRLSTFRQDLVWFALILGVVMWLAVLGVLGDTRSTSTVAHGTAGAGLAILLAVPLVRRWPGTSRPSDRALFLALVGLVFVIGVAWEAAEWSTDALFNTNLAQSHHDSVLDLAADVAGAALGAAIAVWRGAD
jgi:hypothetical protein